MNSIKVIATDLDGTLFYPKKRRKLIADKTKKFLQKFSDDGGKILIVSGRGKLFKEKVEKRLERPVDVVGCNGSFIISQGETIKETFFDSENLKKIIAEIRREQHLMFVSLFCKNCNFVIDISMMRVIPRIAYRFYEFTQGSYREHVTKSEKCFYEQLEKGEVYKVLLFVGPSGRSIKKSEELTKLLGIRYPDMNFAWSNQAIEITPKGCTKSSGIAFYLDYNKISNDNIIVVGDSGNDISMFQSYREQSFCMKHASESVKKYAKHIIKKFYQLEDYIYPSEENKIPGNNVEERISKQ